MQRTRLASVLALGAISAAAALLASAPARAGEEGPIGGCEGSEGGCGGGGPSLPPPKPGLPATLQTSGQYSVDIGTPSSYTYQHGYYQNGQTTFDGGGAFHAIPGGGTTLTVGSDHNTITLDPGLTPLGSVRATADATRAPDAIFPTVGFVARGYIGESYLVQLHADSMASADALAAILSGHSPIAQIDGDWSLTPTGASWGSVTARTGVADFGQELFSRSCSLISYGGTPAGCGSGSYTLALNFTRGSNFADGDGLDFYSLIDLYAEANGGPPGLGYYPGSMDAYIDPLITFSSSLDLSHFSLALGGGAADIHQGGLTVGGGAGGVPEPAAWALMILGFGAAGTALRRRRTLAA